MKITLSSHPAGLILCKVTESLTVGETELLSRGVAKFLAHGKCRIIVVTEEKVSEASTNAIQQILKPQTDLAGRLGGQILFVTPKSELTLDEAIRSIGGPEAKALEPEKEELAEAKREIGRLREQVAQLLTMVGQPSTDTELRKAVEHYRKLAQIKEVRPNVAETK